MESSITVIAFIMYFVIIILAFLVLTIFAYALSKAITLGRLKAICQFYSLCLHKKEKDSENKNEEGGLK
jgi:hypothetical protein